MQQARDLRQEGDELYALLRPLPEGDWLRATPFKAWSVRDVVSHLHGTDKLALASLKSREEFARALASGGRGATAPGAHRELDSAELLARWRETFLEMCERFEATDARQRLAWVGPDMGARMFATARQMETWAHGQDVYDLLGRERRPTDRLKNIAAIGVKTFGWSFANRGLEVPAPVPHVRLEAPSGAIWAWNEPRDDERIEGPALDFCYVVTQVRNALDTRLSTRGEVAERWMAIAQCFAGPPEDPPEPGERV
ncbi:MAG: TIGR03084 family protein [Proteobacteria bacterium]|nr:TIGR03084 family protein [Pseudomonadota bacterium]